MQNEKQEKRTYTKPEVKQWGTVTKLTERVGGNGSLNVIEIVGPRGEY